VVGHDRDLQHEREIRLLRTDPEVVENDILLFISELCTCCLGLFGIGNGVEDFLVHFGGFTLLFTRNTLTMLYFRGYNYDTCCLHNGNMAEKAHTLLAPPDLFFIFARMLFRPS
jgi:hypothetical protein